MRLIREEQQIGFRDVNPFLADWLRQIPSQANPGDSPDARKRLFSDPTTDTAADPQINEEWKEYVEPGLRHLFLSANETVTEDLERFARTSSNEDDEDTYALDIPADHLDQWISSLNQARLVMAAKYAFTEQELEQEIPTLIGSEREMALAQMGFYLHILGFFLAVTEE